MLSHLLAVASVWLVAAVSPGPNFLMTARIAVARSRGAGLAAVCGIGIATAIWGVCGLAGIKALFLAAPWAYAALKLAGAGYLIYSGLRLIVLAERRSEAAGALAVDPRGFSTWRAFWIGLATNLANPRSALSVASVFAVALPAQPSLTLGVASVVLMVAISVGWYACVVGCSRPKPFRTAIGGCAAPLIALPAVCSSCSAQSSPWSAGRVRAEPARCMLISSCSLLH
ncbi:LysE family translocator [Mesorhizobium sp.]|uniref:LysE family translocator n=1 Tax=Mesorhizobium sp. TaxID=1871066 RepID=UPI0025CDACC7|nr:LysE family translocator [Mesorhizobium sp.]